MNKPLKARVIGTGVYLPKRVLSNADLEKIVDTSDEWITTRTGMKERRIASEDECTSNMGAKAAMEAIKAAKIDVNDIDMILVATLSPDYVFPSTACLIQHEIGAKKAAAFDMQAACSGYIYALSMAKAFVENQSYKNVLIVASEKLSSFVDYEDRTTCVLFGDGAAACVVSATGDGLAIEKVCLGADGSVSDLMVLPGGGAKHPASLETIKQKMHYIKMSGREVFKHAVRRMEMVVKQCLKSVNLSESDIGWLIPHQANERIIDAIGKRFSHLSKDRIYKTVHKYGNTSASTIGIALDEVIKGNKVSLGENIMLTAFGAGLTWGACVLTSISGE